MAFLNLSAAPKLTRVGAINTAIGGTGYLLFYSAAYPLSPDITVSAGTLLATLPLSATPGVASYYVAGASILAAGSGGSNGTQTVTGTTGTGTKFTASVTVSGGGITAVLSILTGGAYSVLPTINGEPVTGASLTGATLNLSVSAQLTFNAITAANASANGTAAFARVAVASTAGAAGIVDLDVGTSSASVIVNTTSFLSGVPVSVSSAVIQEG